MNRCLGMAFCLLFSFNVLANNNANRAADEYRMRDFNAQGIVHVRQAIDFYQLAIVAEADPLKLYQIMLDKASAHYFLGTALSDDAEKMAEHQKAMDLADEVMNNMGVDSTRAHELTQDQINTLLNQYDEDYELVLAQALYEKGISLAQWGRLNGIPSSIGRLPVVLGLMDRIEMMGYESIDEYGPYRTVGRVNFILPALFGGSLATSEEYLEKAYLNTLYPGARYSINGYNNLYFAETLYRQGRENQAKRILDAFLAADVSTLAADKEPENREARRQAQELADSWN